MGAEDSGLLPGVLANKFTLSALFRGIFRSPGDNLVSVDLRFGVRLRSFRYRLSFVRRSLLSRLRSRLLLLFDRFGERDRRLRSRRPRLDPRLPLRSTTTRVLDLDWRRLGDLPFDLDLDLDFDFDLDLDLETDCRSGDVGLG